MIFAVYTMYFIVLFRNYSNWHFFCLTPINRLIKRKIHRRLKYSLPVARTAHNVLFKDDRDTALTRL